MVIGVAGKYSAGKDSVAAILLEIIHPVTVDVDALGHEALEEKKEELLPIFGDRILAENGSVDRKALGSIVFGNGEKLRKLESIVHPVMREKVRDFIAERPDRDVVINAALLFYMELHRFCDAVIWVHAPLCTRIRRAKRRDGLSTREALARFRSQKKLKHKQIDTNTDIYTIRNNGSIEKLRNDVAEFLEIKGML
jgi:dephospho-CoA kinase